MKASRLLLFTLLFGGWISTAHSQIIDKWLVSPAYKTIGPVICQEKNILGNKFGNKELFEFQFMDLSTMNPAKNEITNWDSTGKWTEWFLPDGKFVFKPDRDTTPEIRYLCTWVNASRWIKTEIEFETNQMVEIYLDGKIVSTKYEYQSNTKLKKTVTKTIDIEQGVQLLLVKLSGFYTAEKESGFKLLFKPFKGFENSLSFAVENSRHINLPDIIDDCRVNSLSLSPDGNLVCIGFSKNILTNDDTENWYDIYDAKNKTKIHSFRYTNISSPQWVPGQPALSFRINMAGTSMLVIKNFLNGNQTEILSGIKNLDSYQWMPDGISLVYTCFINSEDEKGPMLKLNGMNDRLPGNGTRNNIFLANTITGTKRQLTFGQYSTYIQDISHNGKHILFTHGIPVYNERPFSKWFHVLLDLQKMSADTLFTTSYTISASFSPSDEQLLITGGPSLFGKLGENLLEGQIANNYDSEAYIYDLNIKDTVCITKDFNPAITNCFWGKTNEKIFLLTTDKSYSNIYEYTVDKKQFSKLDPGAEDCKMLSMDKEAVNLFYLGSGLEMAPRVLNYKLANKKADIFLYPHQEKYETTLFGKSMNWYCKMPSGDSLEGYIILPPDFKPTKKYPLIVHYYGGSHPVGRSFGGRYPVQLFAAHGFVVYVVQPDGAVGYGQKFSARLVNNWGKTGAEQIIYCTQKMMEAHSFVDTTRIGCIGASYGGFMTSYLLTRTKMFKAAISHAGISSLSSYWGQGFWGYSYSSEASANSYPWNNPGLYIDQSPLFKADKIRTPLLLLHGNKDTNVPPGESIQLFTALKILGREVELIEIDGENHHVLTRSKRVAWNNTILAWFDRWLKNQPEWWNELYPLKME